ncbi:MAG TPA: UDP-N-acetylmuramoyl-tripeptide--D-alanyl-D-alanine ligase [Clostridiales bacterium]|nr:UDP-N-acetylmuramoyl-tripeptide--D-alanyl-D-alanine ligase [Clostridiales bacterium]HQP69465.1 UDP-N-acetylmuramoyl-tripeptide--D-alanyl-D-alanine ligase [Clostridiales bacterium]
MVRLSELLKVSGITGYENVDRNALVSGGKTDSRLIGSGDIYFAFKGQNTDGHDFVPQCSEKGMAAAVVDKDYKNSGEFPVIYSSDVEKTLGEFASAWRKLHKAKIIGITGTNGKTTTKEILSKILSSKFNLISTFKNYNNQIGVPLTLLSIKDDTEIAIVELGTNHQGEIEYLANLSDPDTGIITNIGEGHLEFFKDKKGVYLEKSSLYEYLYKKGGRIFVNTDDEFLREWKKGNITTFGFKNSPDITFENVKLNGKGFPEFSFNGLPASLAVPGILNLKNALAAAAIACGFGMSAIEITAALSQYRSSDKRYELVRYKNSDVILDCYNANPTSMENFLNDISLMGKDFVLVLGDMLELGGASADSHKRIISAAAKIGFRHVYLYGGEMKKALGSEHPGSSVEHIENLGLLKSEFDKVASEGARIAVKGSRGMKLEKLME